MPRHALKALPWTRRTEWAALVITPPRRTPKPLVGKFIEHTRADCQDVEGDRRANMQAAHGPRFPRSVEESDPRSVPTGTGSACPPHHPQSVGKSLRDPL